jgi:hypothetical protein
MTKLLKNTAKVLLMVVIFGCIATTAHDGFAAIGLADIFAYGGAILVAGTITPDLF